MFIVECRFCKQPSKSVDEKGLCNTCSEAHKIFTLEEIERIQKKVGFKRELDSNYGSIRVIEFTVHYEVNFD